MFRMSERVDLWTEVVEPKDCFALPPVIAAVKEGHRPKALHQEGQAHESYESQQSEISATRSRGMGLKVLVEGTSFAIHLVRRWHEVFVGQKLVDAGCLAILLAGLHGQLPHQSTELPVVGTHR